MEEGRGEDGGGKGARIEKGKGGREAGKGRRRKKGRGEIKRIKEQKVKQ